MLDRSRYSIRAAVMDKSIPQLGLYDKSSLVVALVFVRDLPVGSLLRSVMDHRNWNKLSEVVVGRVPAVEAGVVEHVVLVGELPEAILVVG